MLATPTLTLEDTGRSRTEPRSIVISLEVTCTVIVNHSTFILDDMAAIQWLPFHRRPRYDSCPHGISFSQEQATDDSHSER
jgi:hypothetical protein